MVPVLAPDFSTNHASPNTEVARKLSSKTERIRPRASANNLLAREYFSERIYSKFDRV